MTSLALNQKSLIETGNEGIYPLYPVLYSGCPFASNDFVQYPVEIGYDYGLIDRSIFTIGASSILHWSPILPHLNKALTLGEGQTPLIKTSQLRGEFSGGHEVYLKLECSNPTWSHKDRYNLCATSAALAVGSKGIVVASSGNHGASAAAYAAKAGLPCTVIVSEDCPEHILRFISAYGPEIVKVPFEARWPTLRQYVQEKEYHPVSNYTDTPTGHPFGVEGYKSIAYELFQQLHYSAPGAVLVPTGYGELLFGIWKGFRELHQLGLIESLPVVVSCEPEQGGPLNQAYNSRVFPISIDAFSTKAYAIACRKTGYRGLHVLQNSPSQSLLVSDQEMEKAQRLLGSEGVWCELSSASAVAAIEKLDLSLLAHSKPIVSIITSSGFKDILI